MRDDLTRFYQASLQTQSHLAIYRLPNKNTVIGLASSKLKEAHENDNGFVICPFENKQNPSIISDEISFSLHNNPPLKLNEINEYTKRFSAAYNYTDNSSSKENHPFYHPFLTPDLSRESYVIAVNKAISEIQKGTFKKVVLSRTKKVSFLERKDPLPIFNALCAKYPGAFVSLISSPYYGTWIGASPEILLKQQVREYTTVAVAGTKKSGGIENFNEKEIEEQHIIQTYIKEKLDEKNIFSHRSETENYDTGSLTHLKTSFHFTAASEERLAIAKTLHPTPAVGGYPEKSALRFMASVENYSRALYGGFIGALNKQEMQLYVNIRCMQWIPGYAVIYAGAGITGASTAESEWEETENKTGVIGSVL